MDQVSPLAALTEDEIRVGAWAEVREPLERQLARLVGAAWRRWRRARVRASWTSAAAGVRRRWTLPGPLPRTAPSWGSICRVRCWCSRGARQRVRASTLRPSRCPSVPIRTGLVRRRLLAVWGDVLRRPDCGVHQHSSWPQAEWAARLRLLASAGGEPARSSAASGRVASFAAAACSRSARTRPVRVRQPRARARHSGKSRLQGHRDHCL